MKINRVALSFTGFKHERLLQDSAAVAIKFVDTYGLTVETKDIVEEGVSVSPRSETTESDFKKLKGVRRTRSQL